MTILAKDYVMALQLRIGAMTRGADRTRSVVPFDLIQFSNSPRRTNPLPG
jgi:hypothetical protein